jgi:hypothetical protein
MRGTQVNKSQLDDNAALSHRNYDNLILRNAKNGGQTKYERCSTRGALNERADGSGELENNFWKLQRWRRC